MSKSPWVEKTKKFGWWRIWLMLVIMSTLPLISVAVWHSRYQDIVIGGLVLFAVLTYFTNQRLLDESNDYHFKETKEKDL